MLDITNSVVHLNSSSTQKVISRDDNTHEPLSGHIKRVRRPPLPTTNHIPIYSSITLISASNRNHGIYSDRDHALRPNKPSPFTTIRKEHQRYHLPTQRECFQHFSDVECLQYSRSLSVIFRYGLSIPPGAKHGPDVATLVATLVTTSRTLISGYRSHGRRKDEAGANAEQVGRTYLFLPSIIPCDDPNPRMCRMSVIVLEHNPVGRASLGGTIRTISGAGAAGGLWKAIETGSMGEQSANGMSRSQFSGSNGGNGGNGGNNYAVPTPTSIGNAGLNNNQVSDKSFLMW